MQKRNFFNSPRLLELKKQRKRIFQNKIFLSIFAFLVIFTSLVIISRLSALNIKSVEVKGNKITDSEALKAIARKEIRGNYLWFFPKSNIFYYPKKNIKKTLMSELNRLKDIDLTIINEDKTLQISVTERESKYLWCGNTPPAPEIGNEAPKCYFLDDSGYMFDEAAFFTGDVYFKFYGSINYFSNDIFQKLISLKNMLQDIKLAPVSLYIQDDGTIRIFLSGKKLPTGPEIIFKIDSDLEAAIANLQTALTTEPLLSNLKNKYSSLVYIDLRYGNKVYYKFR